MQTRQPFLAITLTLIFLSACGLPPPELSNGMQSTQQGLNGFGVPSILVEQPVDNFYADPLPEGGDQFVQGFFGNAIPTETANLLNSISADEALAILEMYDTYLRERAAHGLSAPELDAELTAAAIAHSTFMQSSGKYIHSNERGAPVNYIDLLYCNENVGHGFYGNGSMHGDAGMTPGFYGSAGHAANLNNPDTLAVGFGVKLPVGAQSCRCGGNHNDSWATQLFRQPIPLPESNMRLSLNLDMGAR